MMNPDESPYRHQGLAINGYDGLPDAFTSTLHSKLNKESYDGVKNEHGTGILLLSEMDPPFDDWTLESICENVETYLQTYPEGGRGNFGHVYLVLGQHSSPVYVRQTCRVSDYTPRIVHTFDNLEMGLAHFPARGGPPLKVDTFLSET